MKQILLFCTVAIFSIQYSQAQTKAQHPKKPTEVALLFARAVAGLDFTQARALGSPETQDLLNNLEPILISSPEMAEYFKAQAATDMQGIQKATCTKVDKTTQQCTLCCRPDGAATEPIAMTAV
jgi:hypothetical protein